MDTKLALKLRSMKLVLASKEFNISSATKGIYFLEDPHNKRFRKKFLIHPKMHYIRIDVKRHIIEKQICEYIVLYLPTFVLCHKIQIPTYVLCTTYQIYSGFYNIFE